MASAEQTAAACLHSRSQQQDASKHEANCLWDCVDCQHCCCGLRCEGGVTAAACVFFCATCCYQLGVAEDFLEGAMVTHPLHTSAEARQ